MSVKLRISVTKEILEKSRWCGANLEVLKTNCAVAVAVRDIFPDAKVFQTAIFPNRKDKAISLPSIVWTWIDRFDKSSPAERILMEPISFEIEIPDNIIEQINIDELKPLLQNHPTLQLIEA